MRLAFAGTPAFAARALEALHAAGHDIVLVLSQPDRPAGRGMRLQPSAVALAASERNLPVWKPTNLKSPEAREPLVAARPEVVVVAAYGLILPESVLTIPPRGCINIHASLLPRWRGAAPIQRAVEAGDDRTGISIMRMEAGLDTGPVLLERSTAIGPAETAGELTDRLATLGAEAIVDALARLDSLEPVAQDPAGVTYAAKVAKADAAIDWRRDAASLDRQVRAFNPAPGAETRLGDEAIKVWAARPVAARGPAGEVVGMDDGCPVVACGTGGLALAVLQRPGGRRLPADEFLKGRPLPAGTRLRNVNAADA